MRDIGEVKDRVEQAIARAMEKGSDGDDADIRRLVESPGDDGCIRIPSGCYVIEDTVFIPDGLRVMGAGMDRTVLFRDPVTFRNFGAAGVGVGGDGVIFDNMIKGYTYPVRLILEWGTPAESKKSYPAKCQIRDLWIWNNTTGTGPAEVHVHRNARDFVKEGRDYHLKPKPGYEPYPYPHPLVDKFGSREEGDREICVYE